MTFIRVIGMLLEMGMSVVVMFNPSNHDWVLGFSIAQVVQAWFRDHPNVTISDYGVSERHRKYVVFGRSLIGLTHGDGAMEGDNCTIEYVRSPSPPDGWHDRNGYLNRQAVEAFLHDPQDGQVMRFTNWF